MDTGTAGTLFGGGICEDTPEGSLIWRRHFHLPFGARGLWGSLSPFVGTLGLCKCGGCWCCPGGLSPVGFSVVKAR